MVGYKIKNRKDMLTMKKLLCVIMVVAMIATLSTSVFAGTISSKDGSDTSDVNAKYVKEDRVDVYKIEVTWGAMEFDYNASGRQWNTTTHTWDIDPEAPATWTVKSDNTIKLANHSSAEVEAAFSFAANTAYTDLSGTFSEETLTLEIPEAGKDAKVYSVTFTPSGSIPDTHSADAYAKIGTITVQLG